MMVQYNTGGYVSIESTFSRKRNSSFSVINFFFCRYISHVVSKIQHVFWMNSTSASPRSHSSKKRAISYTYDRYMPQVHTIPSSHCQHKLRLRYVWFKYRLQHVFWMNETEAKPRSNSSKKRAITYLQHGYSTCKYRT